MGNGWFVFAIVACIVIGCGFILAVSLLKAAWAHREREALSAEDLRILEESAVLLIEQLKSETDERLAALDEYTRRVEALLHETDQRIALLRTQVAAQEDDTRLSDIKLAVEKNFDLPSSEASILISDESDCVEIARTSGLNCAEVKLIKRLASMQAS